MLITAFIPWIGLISKMSIKRLKIWWDQDGFNKVENTTKCKSNQQYINLYAGGGYKLYYQYSLIMHHVAISFMYGMMLPILFPITLIAIVNIYITDRLLLAYHFQQPEKSDLEIQFIAMKYLKGSPILMFILGCWAMGNRQMFDNYLVPKVFASEPINPDHSYFPNTHSPDMMIILILMFITLAVFGL
jgi:hypothetical protein